MPQQSTSGLKEMPAGAIRAAEYIRTSTSQQRYSVENQTEAIREYAAHHSIAVVRTYIDYGKSGLHLYGRAGLQSLIRDVTSGNAEYSLVLVYDISRWGRFQNIDQSAYYDFLCRRAGVRVTYCTEAFDLYESTMGSLMKDLRRVGAGEYSRALSARVWQAHSTITRRGFVIAGGRLLGLQRCLVDATGTPKLILSPGDRKAIRSDKVIVIPGPRQEVEIVWRIFDLYAHTDLSTGDIANLFNSERVAKPNGKPWSASYIAAILKSPRYVGDNIYNRISTKLRGKSVKNPPDQWVRCAGTFRPLVTLELFEAAETKMRSRASSQWPTEVLISMLQNLLGKEGHLSVKLMAQTPDMPSHSVFEARFGSIREAFAAVGYYPIWRRGTKERLSICAQVRTRIISQIEADLASIGVSFRTDDRRRLLTIEGRWTIYVRVARCFVHSPRNAHIWSIYIPKGLRFDQVLLVGLDLQNANVDTLFLIPKSEAPIPECTSRGNPRLAPYRLMNVEDVYGAVVRHG